MTKPKPLGGPGYHCPYCEEVYRGKPSERRVTTCDISEGSDLAHVEEYYSRLEFGCADDCWGDPDEFEVYETGFQCGECGSLYGSIVEAINCCMS